MGIKIKHRPARHERQAKQGAIESPRITKPPKKITFDPSFQQVWTEFIELVCRMEGAADPDTSVPVPEDVKAMTFRFFEERLRTQFGIYCVLMDKIANTSDFDGHLVDLFSGESIVPISLLVAGRINQAFMVDDSTWSENFQMAQYLLQSFNLGDPDNNAESVELKNMTIDRTSDPDDFPGSNFLLANTGLGLPQRYRVSEGDIERHYKEIQSRQGFINSRALPAQHLIAPNISLPDILRMLDKNKISITDQATDEEIHGMFKNIDFRADPTNIQLIQNIFPLTEDEAELIFSSDDITPFFQRILMKKQPDTSEIVLLYSNVRVWQKIIEILIQRLNPVSKEVKKIRKDVKRIFLFERPKRPMSSSEFTNHLKLAVSSVSGWKISGGLKVKQVGTQVTKDPTPLFFAQLETI